MPIDPQKSARRNTVLGVGELAHLTRDFDWSSTRLGPISDWSKELISLVNVTQALFDLVGDSASFLLTEKKDDEDALSDQIDFSISSGEIAIDTKFLDRPGDTPIVKDAQIHLSRWLVAHDVQEAAAAAIVLRLKSYFVYA
jgi:hypothetical protein